MFDETQLEAIQEAIKLFADKSTRDLAKHLKAVNPGAFDYPIVELLHLYTKGDLLGLCVTEYLEQE